MSNSYLLVIYLISLILIIWCFISSTSINISIEEIVTRNKEIFVYDYEVGNSDEIDLDEGLIVIDEKHLSSYYETLFTMIRLTSMVSCNTLYYNDEVKEKEDAIAKNAF